MNLMLDTALMGLEKKSKAGRACPRACRESFFILLLIRRGYKPGRLKVNGGKVNGKGWEVV
jgi:hypothetical protein